MCVCVFHRSRGGITFTFAANDAKIDAEICAVVKCYVDNMNVMIMRSLCVVFFGAWFMAVQDCYCLHKKQEWVFSLFVVLCFLCFVVLLI